MCGVSRTPPGMPAATQTSHDCMVAMCDGNGEVTYLPDDADLPLDDGSACTAEACSAGVPGHPAKADGTACSDGDVCTQTDVCEAGICTGKDLALCPEDMA